MLVTLPLVGGALSPTLPVTRSAGNSVTRGAKVTGPAPVVDADGDEIQSVRMRTLLLTAPAGLARAPVVSVPAVRIGGLPVNLALVGRAGDDDTLVEMAARADAPDAVREWP